MAHKADSMNKDSGSDSPLNRRWLIPFDFRAFFEQSFINPAINYVFKEGPLLKDNGFRGSQCHIIALGEVFTHPNLPEFSKGAIL
jgi:hypothetical protein